MLFQTQSSPKEILQDFLRGEVEEKSHIKKIKEKQKKVAKRNCLRIRSLPPFVLVQSFFVFSSFLTATVYVKDLSLSLAPNIVFFDIVVRYDEWVRGKERERRKLFKYLILKTFCVHEQDQQQ